MSASVSDRIHLFQLPPDGCVIHCFMVCGMCGSKVPICNTEGKRKLRLTLSLAKNCVQGMMLLSWSLAITLVASLT